MWAALESSWISGGEFHDRFERDLERRFGSPVVICSNGTAALQLAYQCLELGPGDEVIIPGFGYMGAANVARQLGLKPKYADVLPSTWCLDADSLERTISSRTRAIVAIHTYGSACDMRRVLDIAQEQKIPIIEDCAESFGSKFDGRWLGTFGAMGTLSFQATKTITTGEGGGVVSNDPSLLRLARLYRSHGIERDRYRHIVPGNNYRMTNVQAAIGCAQIEKFDTFARKRIELTSKYRDRLSSIAELALQAVPEGLDAVPWTFGVLIRGRDASFRDCVIEELADLNIETRPGFYTPNQLDGYGRHDIPVSDEVAESIIVLPFYPSLATEDVEHICSSLVEACTKN